MAACPGEGWRIANDVDFLRHGILHDQGKAHRDEGTGSRPRAGRVSGAAAQDGGRSRASSAASASWSLPQEFVKRGHRVLERHQGIDLRQLDVPFTAHRFEDGHQSRFAGAVGSQCPAAQSRGGGDE